MRLLAAAVLVLALGPQQQPRFEAVQPELFGVGGTLANAWADFDGDADADLFVGFNGAPNRLYRNDAGRFVDVAAAVGLADARPTRAAAWGDYDADGDPDLLVGFTPGAGAVLRLYRNDGGTFTDATQESGIALDSAAVRQFVWIDYDGDADLDLFVALRDRANMLFRNDNGSFRNIAAEVGLADARRTVGAVWFDYDEDGDLDLYVANQDGDANGLFRNQAGRFTDVSRSAGIAWGGRAPLDRTNGTVRPCTGDVDGDGRIDVFTANYGTNGLFLNRGDGRFRDVSATWGVNIDGRYDTCAFADFDNDGRLDLYVNGTVSGATSYHDYLFRNTGARFMDVIPPNLFELHASHGVQWHDFDRDGAVDLALAGTRADATHSLLRNLLSDVDARRSLSVRVVDSAGHALLAGAEVRLYAAGSRRLLGTRIVDAGSGYNAQNDVPLHFGLSTLARVDIEVIMPARGRRVRTRVTNIEPREYHGRAVVVRARR